jgi:transposase
VTVSTLTDIAYKRESDANVKERILLVRRFNSDGKKVAMICKEELHGSKAWAYKWLSRFQREGWEGLRDKPEVEDLQMYLKGSC